MKYSETIVYPHLHRSGLGNLLWVWAKSFCWASDRGLPLIAPKWSYVDWKRYLLGNADKRSYFGFFSNEGYIKGIERARCLCRKKIFPEQYSSELGKVLVVFEEMGEFSPLIGRHELVRKEFLRIVCTEHIPVGLSNSLPFISLHVRMGDFLAVNEGSLRRGHTNMQQPLEWYIHALRQCRKSVGYSIPAVVFSDGSPEELAPLLSEERVSLSQECSALSDLIALSSGAVLIASRSSFSLWAAYIGQMPTLYYRGARPWYERVVHPDADVAWEIELLDGESIPPIFSELIKQQVL